MRAVHALSQASNIALAGGTPEIIIADGIEMRPAISPRRRQR
jgi:hypothetical protein